MPDKITPQAPSKRSASRRSLSEQLATAFDGHLEPVRTTLGYRMGVGLVFGAMLILPLVYFAIVYLLVHGLIWYAVHAAVMFDHIPAGRAWLLAGVAYLAPLLAGGLVVLFLILPLLWRRKKIDRPMWVDRTEQPLLFAYIDNLCDTMNVPRPIRIDVSAEANASAHIDNGLMGIFDRKLVLTLGLPLAQTMNLRQFTGVVAHELGHFAQGGRMRVSYAVHRINMWFFRLAFTRSRVDDAIIAILRTGGHWTISLLGLVCQLMVSLTRLLLRLMATISHALSMHLSRQAEFDADYHAARIVGSEAMAQSLEMVPFLSAAGSLAIISAQAGWAKRELPDDLVTATEYLHAELPEGVKTKITGKLLATETHWFDTHPPLFERIGKLKKAQLKGVLKVNGPAKCLFKDFDELARLATVSLYQIALGDKLQPEHLVITDISVLRKLIPEEPAKPVLRRRSV